MKNLKKKLIESTEQINECGQPYTYSSGRSSYDCGTGRSDSHSYVYGGGYGCGGGYIDCRSYRKARSTTRSTTKKSIQKTPAKNINVRIYGRSIEMDELIDELLEKCKKQNIQLTKDALKYIRNIQAACKKYNAYIDELNVY